MLLLQQQDQFQNIQIGKFPKADSYQTSTQPKISLKFHRKGQDGISGTSASSQETAPTQTAQFATTANSGPNHNL